MVWDVVFRIRVQQLMLVTFYCWGGVVALDSVFRAQDSTAHAGSILLLGWWCWIKYSELKIQQLMLVAFRCWGGVVVLDSVFRAQIRQVAVTFCCWGVGVGYW